MRRKHDKKPKSLGVFRVVLAVFLATAVLAPSSLIAAEAGHGIDGASLSLLWVLPFAGILLSIALLPLLAGSFWHHHYGKVSLFWGLAIIAPLLASAGSAATVDQLLHTLLLEYLPFIILIAALFTICFAPMTTGAMQRIPWCSSSSWCRISVAR
jgi:hypothetical protein